MPLGGLLPFFQKHRRGTCSWQHLSQGLEDEKELLAWRRRGRRPARRTVCAAEAGCGVCREGP